MRGAKQNFSWICDLRTLKFLQKFETAEYECTIPTLTKGSMVACMNSEKANLLNASFINSFNVAILELGIEDSKTPRNVRPDKLLWTEEVYMLRTLNVSKSNGHDDISARKQC